MTALPRFGKWSKIWCVLCYEPKSPVEFSRDADGHLTTVCLVCRQKELQAVVEHLAAILGRLTEDKPAPSENEITQEVVIKTHPCGHIRDCWCLTCHICEDV